MKSILLILGLICWSAIRINAQNSSRFPIDPTSIWRVDHIRNGVSDENHHEEGDEIFKYFIQGDTVIGSRQYFKIFKTGTAYLDVIFQYENVYVGALRDEGNQFFFVNKGEGKEVLLYNFNANVDDTIQVPYVDGFVTKIVSAVDSLPDGRKIIHFNPKEPIIGCGDQYMIEGIGGSGGLLEGPACFHFWTFDNHLVCYVQNGMLIYHDNQVEFNCEITDNQVVEPYIDSTCVWRVDKEIITDTLSDFEKLNYFVCGDTIIKSVKYLKICKTGTQLYIDENGKYFSAVNHSVYVGALRENNKNLFFIDRDYDSEKILFNFNLQPDDIVDGHIFYNDTVKAVDILLDNRKVFYLSDERWQRFIIEGIGSDKGLLEEKTENSTLVCFTKNKVPVYHNGTGSECILALDNIACFGCDNLKILPSIPTIHDQVKLVMRLCYQVSYKNPVPPAILDKKMQTDQHSIYLELYCKYDDLNNNDNIKLLYPLFDTIVLGYLEKGNYYVGLDAHTVHRNGEASDTIFYDKGQYLSFKVTESVVNIPDVAAEMQYKIYPVPSKDFVVIEISPAKGMDIRSVELFDMLGKKVKKIDLKEQGKTNIIEIDIRDLTQGVYTLRIMTENTGFTGKIIVE